MNWKKTILIGGGSALATAVSIQLASAQSPSQWRQATEQSQPVLQLSQSYHGTRPGDGNSLPKVAELKGKDGLWITWPGFLVTDDGGSRVFIQTTAPLKYTMKSSSRRIVLSFKKTQVHLSNNQNPLVTAHFNTPVSRIDLRKRGKKTDLILDLKTKVTPIISQSTDADGFSYLFLDFAPGDYPTEGIVSTRRTGFNSSNTQIESEGNIESLDVSE